VRDEGHPSMKRSIWTILSALAAGVALTASVAVPGSAVPVKKAPEESAAQATVAAMEPGWNLGNSLDATGGETGWGNPVITRELIDAIAAQGYKSIRVPVTWTDHMGDAPDYAVDPVFMERVAEVVDWSLDAGFYVLLNVHHDSWKWLHEYSENPEEVDAKYIALWGQIAERFVDHPHTLLLESINEPQFVNKDNEIGDALLHEQNVTFHEVVRATGGNNADRLLVLPTLHTNDQQPRLDALAATIEQLDDPNLVATTHYYSFWPFSANVAGGIRYDETAQAHLRDSFTRLTDTFISKGIPVIIGEYGLLGYGRTTGAIQRGERLKYFEEFGYLARTTGAASMFWDNGEMFDRHNLEWFDQEHFDYMSTSWSTRSGVASTDQVFVRPGSDVAAQTITLQPNGLKLKGLYHGKSKLKQGRDYTISGNELTLSAALQERLVGDGEHGVRAELEVRFSRGLPWRVFVISADTPVFQDATGTTDSFAIPTAFHGDRLATMEATYLDDGTPAGPHDWTSFKDFNQTLRPDVPAGEIVVRPAFFAEVDDQRPVQLTFHFWSGDQVTYTVVRDGTTVTGTVD
jgi:aryl-phospho-beta-D-glucosidase BglC (GH1 family)